jgi:hypothetical protein
MRFLLLAILVQCPHALLQTGHRRIGRSHPSLPRGSAVARCDRHETAPASSTPHRRVWSLRGGACARGATATRPAQDYLRGGGGPSGGGGRSAPSGDARAALDREVARLAVPALAGLLITPLLSLIDTFYVGRFCDSAALGAVSTASEARASVARHCRLSRRALSRDSARVTPTASAAARCGYSA